MSAFARARVLAGADMLERMRRSSFLAILASAVYLAYVVATGKMSLTVGDCQGVANGAWVGTAVSIAASTYFSLAGFYIVRGALAYDRRTGVGDILRTTSMTPTTYMVTKAASNLAVLLSMVGVLMLSSVITLLAHHVPGGVNIGALLEPFIAVTMPTMVAVAGLAVLFDALPWVSGGIGNIAYFALWITGLVLAGTRRATWDPVGLGLYVNPLFAAVRRTHPHASTNFSLGHTGARLVGTFQWDGLPWTPELALTRVLWCAVGIAAVVLAAFVYRPETFRGADTRPAKKARARNPESSALVALTTRSEPVRLRPLPAARSFGLAPLIDAEVRLLLKGLPRAWYLVALGLAVAGAAVPLSVSRNFILPIAWLWPMLRFSHLGVRDAEHGVEPILLATPRAVPRLTLSSWAAGFLVAALLGAGCLARFALAGDGGSVLAWFGGAAVIPAAALAMGAWSGTTRLFEAVYLVAWYIGPMNHVPALDYSGATDAAVRHGSGAVWLAVAAGGVLAAYGAKLRRLRV